MNIYKAAQSADLEFYDANASIEDLARKIVAGGTVPSGPFAGESFGVPGLSDEEIAGSIQYLQFNPSQKLLIYREGGGGPTLVND